MDEDVLVQCYIVLRKFAYRLRKKYGCNNIEIVIKARELKECSNEEGMIQYKVYLDKIVIFCPFHEAVCMYYQYTQPLLEKVCATFAHMNIHLEISTDRLYMYNALKHPSTRWHVIVHNILTYLYSAILARMQRSKRYMIRYRKIIIPYMDCVDQKPFVNNAVEQTEQFYFHSALAKQHSCRKILELQNQNFSLSQINLQIPPITEQ